MTEEPEIRLPRNIEAEAALLGAILIDNSMVDYVGELQPEHFFEQLHGRIFERARSLINEGKTASPVSLKPYFEGDEAIAELGGPGYLAKLTADGAGLIGARDFASQIRDLALLREIHLVGMELSQAALDTSDDIDPAQRLDEAQERLFSIGASESARETFEIGKAIEETLAEIEAEARGEGIPPMKPKGIAAWNSATGGMSEGDLTILAGRPGMMKTGMAIKIATAAALDGIATEFFSLEMSKRQLVIRALSDLSFTGEGDSPTHDRLKFMNLSNAERSTVARANQQLTQSLLRIHTEHELTISKLASKLRQAKRLWARRGKSLHLVVIDYLQLMGGRKGKEENRVQEISAISRGLKSLAKQFDVHIVALSQLSRQVEQREDKRPVLSDLRESGSIEQDADNVIFLYREYYYLSQAQPQGKRGEGSKWEDWKADSEACKNDMQLLARKVRSGAASTQMAKVYLEHQAIRDPNWQDEGRFA